MFFFCLWITNHEYFLMKCQQAQQRWINQAAGNPPWENFHQNPFETTGQRQHRGNASSVNTKKRRGFSDHKHVQRQQQNTKITPQAKPMTSGNTDCRCFKKRWGDQAYLKFTVKIIFLDATIDSKSYMICTIHVKNTCIFPMDWGQPISFYTMSNNGFYSKL